MQLSWVNKMYIYIKVRSWNCSCLITWFCYQLIAKPGNKTAALPWTDPCLVATIHPIKIQSCHDGNFIITMGALQIVVMTICGTLSDSKVGNDACFIVNVGTQGCLYCHWLWRLLCYYWQNHRSSLLSLVMIPTLLLLAESQVVFIVTGCDAYFAITGKITGCLYCHWLWCLLCYYWQNHRLSLLSLVMIPTLLLLEESQVVFIVTGCDAYFAITGRTTGCLYDNLRFHQ